MVPSDAAVAEPWAGWHRRGPGHRWAKVCEGPSWDACWAILVSTAEGGDLTALPHGRDPNRPALAGRVGRHD